MRRIRFTTAVALTLVLAACGEAASTDPTITSAPAPPTTSPPAPTTLAPNRSGPLPASFHVVGRSAGGRPLVAADFGEGDRRVFVIGGIHGDERTGVETSLDLLDHVRATLPDGVRMRWLIDANPDGSAARDRDNDNQVDLNRNWPTGHEPSAAHGDEPLSEPETRALLTEIEAFDPMVIVAMHSAREGPFVNYDGPGVLLAAAFARGATGEREWEVVPQVGWPTPGSLGTHFGTALGLPVITIEGSRWDAPAAVVEELQGGLDAMLAALVTGATVRAPVCDDHVVGLACTELTRRVSDAIADDVVAGTTSFLLKEAGGLVHAAGWADSPIYPASSIKVIHLAHLLRTAGDDIEAALGQVIPYDESCSGSGATAERTIDDLVESMLITSDNGATNALQHWIGPGPLNTTASALGLVGTRIEHGFGCGGPANDPANRSTVADLVTVYDGIATGTTLTGAARDRFVGSLLDITGVIAAELGIDPPAGTRVVAKAGWYGLDLSIAGIAETPNGTFVFGAATSGVAELRNGFTIERVAAALLHDLLLSTSD